ncbi:MAG: hypothetical protein RLO50_10270 [Azospirillaceae bacterium]
MLRTILVVTATTFSALSASSANAQVPPGSGGGASCACVCSTVDGNLGFIDYTPVNGSCGGLLNRTCNVEDSETHLIRSGRVLLCDLEQSSDAAGQRADTADPNPPGGGTVLPGGQVFNNQVLTIMPSPSLGTAPPGTIFQPLQLAPTPGVLAPR